MLTAPTARAGERKQITVLFADLKTSMELLAEWDPEDARALIDPVIARMIDAVHEYEGTVNQVMGDGIMALFGAPVAHEDHAVRAGYAALRIQDGVRRYAEQVRRESGVPVAVRIGINSGDVVVRAIGDHRHMDYTAVGQTTHIAARMQQLAQPGSIVATAQTLALAEGFVSARPLGPIAIKGRAEPIQAHELTGAGAARTRLQASAARGFARFVGRAAELAALGEALDRAAAGHGQLVGLVGDAGVGKSRLIWEVAHSERTRAFTVLEASAATYTQATPFSSLVELLKPCVAWEPGDGGDRLEEKIRSAVGPDGGADAVAIAALFEALPRAHAFHALDPPERRRRAIDAVKRLVLRASQTRPLLLILEDLQWADSDTVRWLDDLVTSLPAARIAVLVTYRCGHRHEWASRSVYSQIRVDPLEPGDLDALLSALLGDDESLAPLRRMLVERTEGNPLFLEESVRSLVEAGALAGARGGYRLRGPVPDVQVPGTVQAVLGSRIDRLPPEDKNLLQWAAVLGTDVPMRLLLAMPDPGGADVLKSLERLQASEFLQELRLFPETEYAFRHGLTHDVAYASLVHERRTALHAEALRAMERLHGDDANDHVDALARHALGGEVWDKAIDYLREAGARAYRRGALRKAQQRYEQALELLPRLPNTPENKRRGIDVRLDLHAPLFSLGQIPRVTALHEDAAALAGEIGDQPRLGRVLSRLGLYAFTGARYAQGIDHVDRALAIAERTEDLDLTVIALYLLGINHAGLGHAEPHFASLHRIVDGPYAEPSKRVVGLSAAPYVLACAWLASSYAWLADFPRAEHYASRAVREADESGHPYAQAIAHSWRVLPVAHRGEFDQAIPLCEVAVALCEKKELLGWLPFAYSLWGWVLSGAGRPDEGVPFSERAIALFEMVGITAFLSLQYVQWAEGLLISGRVDGARRAAERAVDLASRNGERSSESWARCVLGDVALEAGAGDARLHHETALAIAEAQRLPMLCARSHLGLARMASRAGDRAAARQHLAVAGEIYHAARAPRWLARVAHVEAALA
jgi:class 3 adenylate cyclase/tetratricopeptide (TPR) repeat protein